MNRGIICLYLSLISLFLILPGSVFAEEGKADNTGEIEFYREKDVKEPEPSSDTQISKEPSPVDKIKNRLPKTGVINEKRSLFLGSVLILSVIVIKGRRLNDE